MNDVRVVQPVGGPMVGSVVIPGSKSQTNRALLCAALAEGDSRLSGVLFADDTEAMLEAVVSMGAGVKVDRAQATLEVSGTGGDLTFEKTVIDCRSSGTTSRFLLPVLVAGKGDVKIDGSAFENNSLFDYGKHRYKVSHPYHYTQTSSFTV